MQYDVPRLRLAQTVGPLAQSVEQRTFNPWVVGSSPTGPTFIAVVANPRNATQPTTKLPIRLSVKPSARADN